MLILPKNIVSSGGWQLVTSGAARGAGGQPHATVQGLKTTGATSVVAITVASSATTLGNIVFWETTGAINTYQGYRVAGNPSIFCFVSTSDPLATSANHSWNMQVSTFLGPNLIMAFRHVFLPGSRLIYEGSGSIGEQGNVVSSLNDMLQIVVWAPRRADVSIDSIDAPLDAISGPSVPLLIGITFGGLTYYFGSGLAHTVPWGPIKPPGIIETGAADAGTGAWFTFRPSP